MRVISTESYEHRYCSINDKELFFHRIHNYKTPHRETDVYGKFWSCVFADIPNQSVEFQYEHLTTNLSGKCLILLPPDSTVTWDIHTPRLEWFGYVNLGAYPLHYPQRAAVFQLETLHSWMDMASLDNIVVNSKELPLIQKNKPNPHAKTLKGKLDLTFQSNTPLGAFAEEMDFSREWLIRTFKKQYGLSPVAYRNRKRILQSFIDLQMRDSSIIEVSSSNGFEDLSHFYEHFKRLTRATPGSFAS